MQKFYKFENESTVHFRALCQFRSRLTSSEQFFFFFFACLDRKQHNKQHWYQCKVCTSWALCYTTALQPAGQQQYSHLVWNAFSSLVLAAVQWMLDIAHYEYALCWICIDSNLQPFLQMSQFSQWLAFAAASVFHDRFQDFNSRWQTAIVNIPSSLA